MAEEKKEKTVFEIEGVTEEELAAQKDGDGAPGNVAKILHIPYISIED